MKTSAKPVAENDNSDWQTGGRSYVTDGIRILYRARGRRECTAWLMTQPVDTWPSIFSTGARASQQLLELVHRQALLCQTSNKLVTARKTQRDKGLARATHIKLLKNQK